MFSDLLRLWGDGLMIFETMFFKLRSIGLIASLTRIPPGQSLTNMICGIMVWGCVL